MEIDKKQNILNQFNDEDDIEFDSKCARIAEEIRSGQLVIVQLIEELGSLLVNPSPSKREMGVLILNQVLKNLPSDFLNLQHLTVIAAFYTDRLKDHHQVVPAVLRGILTITEFRDFPGERVPVMLTSLFHNIACQQQQQMDRHTIYAIFEVLLKKYTRELLSTGMDFVYGVISSIDGERDPRNLLFLLDWLKVFLKTVSLGHLSEEMFEVLACYFPVDFKAPSQEPNSITREALAEALCPCLCAIPEFAEYCIPLALEKLDSSLLIAKMDSLKLLEEGCNTFEVASYEQHAQEIFSQIQKEVLSGTDPEVIKQSLCTLTKIINKLLQNKEKCSCEPTLKNILDTLKGNLLPDSKMFERSANILYHVALASPDSATYVLKEIVPLLINTYIITITVAHKVIILKCLIHFVEMYAKQYQDINVLQQEELSTSVILCLKAIVDSDNNLKSTGFDCLTKLVEYLPLDVRKALYSNIHNLLIEPLDQNVRNSMLGCFRTLAVFYQDEIKENVLYKTEINGNLCLELYLSSICVIAGINEFRDVVIRSLLNYIGDVELGALSVKYIRKLLEEESSNGDILETFLHKGTVDAIIGYAFREEIRKSKNENLLLDISSALKILIGSQNCKIQNEILEQHLEEVYNYKQQSEEISVILLDGLLSRLHSRVSVDYKILEVLLPISIASDNNIIRDVAGQLLANLINKKVNDDVFIKYLGNAKEICFQHMNSYKYNSIITISWIVKALVMRNHQQANIWIELFLNLMEQHVEAMKGFKIIMNDGYESMNSLSHCNKMLLYRQKFFEFVINRITVDTNKITYLLAVGYLIEFAPQQAVILHFKKILRPILLCLEKSTDQEVLGVLLQTIKHILADKKELIEDNLSDFLLRILKLTAFKPSMKVRIEAIQCIQHFTLMFPVYKLLPFKQAVIQQMGLCIDDKKRLVRKEAMEARSLWFLIDAPI